MLRAMVVEDEAYILECIVSQLRDAHVVVVAEFTSPKLALNWFREHLTEVDAVFLDVNMPVLDGFAVAGVIHNIDRQMPVVFITAYDHHAVKAFETAAIDYILKPLTAERLEKTLLRLSERMRSASGTNIADDRGKNNLPLSKFGREELYAKKRQRELLLRQLSGKHRDDVLLFSSGNWEWVAKNRESCFGKEKNANHVQVLVGDKPYETTEGLNDFFQNFPQSGWIICHRAVYVNIEHIETVEIIGRDDSYLLLKGSDQKIPVSRGYADRVVLAFHKNRSEKVQ